MTSNEDLFRDTFESLNSVVSVSSIDETATASETLLITGDSSKEVNDNDIPLIDASGTDMLTTRNAYVLTLPKESLATLQGTFLTLPFVKTTDRHFLNTVEPPTKKKKSDTEEQENVKEMVDVLVKTVMDRLQSIENKLEDVSVKCQNLEGKVDNMLSQTKNLSSDTRHAVIAKKGRPGGPLIVGVTPQVSGYSTHSSFCGEEGSAHRSVSVNSEADYPEGSWLGDPDNPHLRVRCDISPKDLEYCNRMCTTPEKMSLTLLDYLFDRETQACSNISGTGKHGKKQLDPKKIYGIRCHLIHRFGISDQDWRRYRQNMDSKCRTAFRRKQKGMPLTVKGFRERPSALDDSELLGQAEKSPQTTVTSSTLPEGISEDNFPGVTSPCTKQNLESNSIIPVKIESSDIDTISLQIQGITGSQKKNLYFSPSNSLFTSEVQDFWIFRISRITIIHTDHGDIQVLHATPEQLAALKGGHDLQILADGNIISEMRIEDSLPS